VNSYAKYNALYHGFRAIALRMSGKDASDAERMMRQLTSNPDYEISWDWDDLNQWLKRTKLVLARKAAVENNITELIGTPRQ
jgi:hypothetical protein